MWCGVVCLLTMQISHTFTFISKFLLKINQKILKFTKFNLKSIKI